MGLTEHRYSYMTESLFVPNGNLVIVFQDPLSSIIRSTQSRLEIPRGARGTLKRIQTTMLGIASSLNADVDCNVILANPRVDAVDPFITSPSDEQIANLKPIWHDALHLNHNQSTAVGVNVEQMKSNTDIDLSKLPAHRGQEIVSKGAQSNDPIEWVFMGWYITAALGIRFTAMVTWDVEYLESSRSEFADWDMDEVTEAEQNE